LQANVIIELLKPTNKKSPFQMERAFYFFRKKNYFFISSTGVAIESTGAATESTTAGAASVSIGVVVVSSAGWFLQAVNEAATIAIAKIALIVFILNERLNFVISFT